MGLLDTGGNVLLIWLQGSGRVEPFMNAMHFFFAFGALLSPLVIEGAIRLARSDEGFATAFYLYAALLVVFSVPLMATRGPRPPQQKEDSSSPDQPPQPNPF